MSTKQEDKTAICCPKFNPRPWDGKVFDWHEKPFVKAKVFTLFYMPINFGSVISRLMTKVEKAHGTTPDWMCLSDHTSKWNMDIYVAVDKPIDGLDNTTLSGKFMSKVYEGDFKETGKWCKDFANYLEKKGAVMEKMYMWYTTCPTCSKKYGKNYVVIAAKVA